MLTATLACLGFLLGTWNGDSTGADQGKGWFSFEPRYGGRVLLRTNHAEYPPQAGKAASVHDDLMAIEPAAEGLKATFVDNEGNAIGYVVTCGEDKKSAQFWSPASGGKPSFRLSYRLLEDGKLAGSFEVAGKPYKTWTAAKRQ